MLHRLEAWPLDVLRSKLAGNPLFREPHDLDRYFRYYKQFMFFKGCGVARTCGLHSLGVDAIWHTHLLYTAEYANFCQQVFGQFIHHTPCDVLKLSADEIDEWNSWMFAGYPSAFTDVCPLDSPDAPILCG